ncbi:MAG TPA: hypothetical protein VEF35_01715 [Candidatus Bathyarchaeia archaeon]|nr:hypothetical protein [Candidatus Bathyarchaeia archaeon]
MMRKNFREGSKTMTAKLNYEDAAGRVSGTSLAPERVMTSRHRILKALEAALHEFIMLDEGSRSEN